MFYIVKVYAAGDIQTRNFDELDAARSYIRAQVHHAELYVWLAGREEFMESVN